MDTYIDIISTTVAPEAPLYPLEWLQKRNMEEIRWFQLNSVENMNSDHINANKVWWRQAVAGINLWKTTRKNSLIVTPGK